MGNAPRLSRRAARSALLALLLALPSRGAAQVATAAPDTGVVEVDPGDVVSAARAAQARFEGRRIHFLPLTLAPFGGDCDEIVGRLCTTYGEGEWYPIPEDPEIPRMRSALVAELDPLQELAPASGWILGQRVWYRADGGAWADARAVAAACGRVDPWWCAALEGFALHGLGAYHDAENTFERALMRMDEETARRWRVPRWSVDDDARELLADAEEEPPRERALLDRLWRLGDPLYLVEGNDRLTAHYARWTVARIRDGARNPFRLRWREDLTELTVRHGWEMGWERTPARDYSAVDQVVGHKHPEGRDFLPSGEVLRAPTSATDQMLRAGRRRPRSLYAPAYAPVLLPMEGQMAVFPRAGEVAVLSTHFLPEDTTHHADHAHPLPWMEPGDQADIPDRRGLFAVPLDSGTVRALAVVGDVDGAAILRIPPGSYLISAESWSPARRRAGRLRRGLEARGAVPDVATLSDLVLLRPATSTPETLEAAADLALLRPVVRPGQTFAIGWEVSGLGFRAEGLRFQVSVERTDEGVLRRLGSLLGLVERPRPLALSWEEAGPEEPGHLFRYLSLDLPVLEPGRYRVRLVLRTEGRSDTVATRDFRVEDRPAR